MLRSLKCQRRRKHIGKKTWSVTIVIFVRTGSQDWTQSVITSENRYSFMIFQPGVHQTVFDSQQLHRTFWLSRALPSNFFSTKRVAKNSESKAEGKWRRHSNWKKKQGVLISTYLFFKPTSLFWAHEVNTSRNQDQQTFGTRWTWDCDRCLDLTTAKIQTGVAGRQFQPECYCYRDRTTTCCVGTWNRTGVARS